SQRQPAISEKALATRTRSRTYTGAKMDRRPGQHEIPGAAKGAAGIGKGPGFGPARAGPGRQEAAVGGSIPALATAHRQGTESGAHPGATAANSRRRGIGTHRQPGG